MQYFFALVQSAHSVANIRHTHDFCVTMGSPALVHGLLSNCISREVRFLDTPRPSTSKFPSSIGTYLPLRGNCKWERASRRCCIGVWVPGRHNRHNGRYTLQTQLQSRFCLRAQSSGRDGGDSKTMNLTHWSRTLHAPLQCAFLAHTWWSAGYLVPLKTVPVPQMW